MLDVELRESIQTAYSRWLTARGFRARSGQKQMIAAIARAFAETGGVDVPAPATVVGRLAVEAGTGTGKTIAYLLAGLPVAVARGRRLVIATATVNLQEQLVLRDLPDLAAASGLAFRHELAKGRGRYLCPQRLDLLMSGSERASAMGSLFEEDGMRLDSALHGQLHQAFATGKWAGDRDQWGEAIADELWRPLTTDHRGCTSSRCPHFRHCPYFEARGRLEGAEVIVANHDLVLADLALGGGVILPAPEDTFYVFDEAHHLAAKAQSHFGHRLRFGATAQWMDSASTLLATMVQRLGRPPGLEPLAQQAADVLVQAGQVLRDLRPAFGAVDFKLLGDGRRVCRFPRGVVPPAAVTAALAALQVLEPAVNVIDGVVLMLNEASDGTREWPHPELVADWQAAVGVLARRLEMTFGALDDMAAAAGTPSERPVARWLSLTGDAGHDDCEYSSAPISVGELLRDAVWGRAAGVLLTSATLAPLGDFDVLLARLGLPPETPCLRLASPFDYARLGVLSVPRQGADPRDAEAHIRQLVASIPPLLVDGGANLVLFTAWRQLNAVLDALPKALRKQVLAQGEHTRTEIVRRHCAAIDAGEPSTIFGLASFAEGVDLPGAYVTHVIIAKLPFAVPDDPLEEGTAEWVAERGGDPFAEVSVPAAALKLVQACGRLIRSETDHGRITLLDARVLTRGYGRRLLAALPPFRRVFD